ncbi:sphingomyelin phosphodiesterase-like isoform X2 [Macrobrachium nipponense]|uniref:sphingomyelin phosphodiesterase-like isoform X2 n=1 Tax=Macrobrachium nipponense TaxID=159736 RepID=UPI0030C8AA98
MRGLYGAGILLLVFVTNSFARGRTPGASSFSPSKDSLASYLHSPAMGPEDRYVLDGVQEKAICRGCEIIATSIKVELALGQTYEQMIKEALFVCMEVIKLSELSCRGYVQLFTPSQPTLKVLHISDMHLDPLYVPGSNADCAEDLCCREESGTPATPDAEAWFWGDYRDCDSPPWMIEDMLSHIRTEHTDISYVMWTGDVVPHNMWATTRDWNTRLIKDTNEIIQSYFPDIPVFPVIGNHEMDPINMFPDPDNAPEEFSADWLYGALANQWEKVIPGLDVSTVLYGGFYSVPVKPGFRIISVNSMFGYTINLWLYENSNDVAHELKWLEAELWKAEQEGELVHLIGHIPPGLLYNERSWSREYTRIINRYENIVRGQFFGHTHNDEFEVFHDGERPFGVAYVAPSQTPWTGLNPSYRIYTVDGERPDTTRMVLDHDTYIMNLTEAHETNATRWHKLYSAKEAYGMPSLTPQDWYQLGHRMAEDRSLFDLYFKHFVSAGDPLLQEGCDDICYVQRVCDVMTSDRNDLDACYGAIRRMKGVSGLQSFA